MSEDEQISLTDPDARSMAQGGGFVQGFAGSAIGAVGGMVAGESGLVGSYGDGITELQLARAAISAAAGCAASAAAGGKCAPAAVTAAFASIYNGEGWGRQFAVAGGQVLGTLGGFLVGGTVGGGCALLTAGTCTPIGLGLAGASSITGYAVGGSVAGAIYDTIVAPLGTIVSSKSPESIAVDSKGNAIPLGEGEYVTGSPDGKWIQVRNPDGSPTGVRIDGPHRPETHSDPRALQPHAHVPGRQNADGTPWLPVRQK